VKQLLAAVRATLDHFEKAIKQTAFAATRTSAAESAPHCACERN
jgi:hypothetical protein